MTNKLIQDILKFRDDRGWGQAHSPRNLASSIIIEDKLKKNALKYPVAEEED